MAQYYAVRLRKPSRAKAKDWFLAWGYNSYVASTSPCLWSDQDKAAHRLSLYLTPKRKHEGWVGEVVPVAISAASWQL